MAKKKKRSHKRRRRVGSSNQPSVVSGTRRRKHKTYGTVRKHRRRVKGMGKITGSESGDLILGAIAGVAAGIMIDKITPASVSEKIRDAIKIAGGAGAAYMGSKKKSSIMTGLGLGLAANGISTGVKTFGILQGIEDFMHGIGAGGDSMLIEMNGIDNDNGTNINGPNQDTPVISGPQDSYMNGDGNDGMGDSDMPNVIQG
jgi:hypothetical protein